MPTINFDRLTEASVRKLSTGLYAHDGDKYPGLKLNVGKRKSTWYLRERVGNKFKSTKLGAFPDMTLSAAKSVSERQSTHQGNATTAQVKTMRDAWNVNRKDALKNNRASEKHLDDLERKLDRNAANILAMAPAQVTLMDIRSTLNDIDSVSTRHHVKAALSSCFAMLDIPSPIQRGKLQLAVVGSRSTYWDAFCKANKDHDPEDWSPMWNAIMKQRQSNVLRGTAWIVMLFTGMRSEDVRELKWDQVDFQRGELHLEKLKSGVDRTIPVSGTVIRALMAIRNSDSEFVFPAHSQSGYLDHLDRLKHDGEWILRQHDTRKHFQEACNEAMLPDHVMLFLRGDKGGNGSMLARYTRRVGKSAPAMVEDIILERIQVDPSFED